MLSCCRGVGVDKFDVGEETLVVQNRNRLRSRERGEIGAHLNGGFLFFSILFFLFFF